MGWLFAVALGLQERRGAAVWRALPPLALGHGLAIGVVVALAVALEMVIPLGALRWGVAGILLFMGLYRFFRHGHPRYGGMQVGFRELTIWSFLMATAHGAGLMVLPIVLGMRERAIPGAVGVAPPDDHLVHSQMQADSWVAAGTSGHAGHVEASLSGVGANQWEAFLATLLHTGGYLLITGLVALLVYRKLGLRLLRTAWINLDLIWAGALVLTAIATPFL
jgi:hypothetical protein